MYSLVVLSVAEKEEAVVIVGVRIWILFWDHFFHTSVNIVHLMPLKTKSILGGKRSIPFDPPKK